MSYQKNADMYKAIKDRADILKREWTVGDEPVARTLARELVLLQPDRSPSAAYQMICYYLRGGNKKTGSKDSRRAYSAKELANLDLMSTKERSAYAEHTGRSLRAVDAALARFRKADASYALMKNSTAITAEAIDQDNHYDFSSNLHLKIRGRTRTQLAAARTFLIHPYGLSLRAPNILYHAATKRRFYMSALQQDSLLEDPKKFLYICSDLIKNNWVVQDFDPIADNCLEFDDSGHRPAPVHTHEKYKETKRLLAISEEGHKLLEKLIRNEELQEGFPLHKSLKTLKIWLDRALELAHPKDFYVDDVKTSLIKPKDLSDHKILGTHYSCTRCACQANLDTKICPSCLSGDAVVRVSELESDEEKKVRLEDTALLLGEQDDEDSQRSEQSEDDWMKDWKPRGGAL